MKKILVFVSLAVLSACNSKDGEKKEPAKTETEPMAQMINSPYPVNYSSQFVMGDPKHAEAVLNLWKIWDGGDLSKSKNIFADSVEIHFADGSMLKGPRDSIVAVGQKVRTSLGNSVSTVDAVMAVKSTDKNENWALIWGMEKDSNKGKVDSFYLQETWRFNKDGKADMMYQFRAAAAPPKMPRK